MGVYLPQETSQNMSCRINDLFRGLLVGAIVLGGVACRTSSSNTDAAVQQQDARGGDGPTPCLSNDGVTAQVPGGCLSCATGAHCCKKSGGCSGASQSIDEFCPYTGNYPTGCWENGSCRTDQICQKVAPPEGPHKITFHNQSSQEIWVGAFATGADATTYTAVGTWDPMWKLTAGDSKAITVPFTFKDGRFWARTGCTYTGGEGLTCAVGDCQGLNCTVSGLPPVTLAEFTMMGGDGKGVDNYDVSMVDGYNILIKITPRPQSSTASPDKLFCDEIACKTNPVCWSEGLWPSAASPKGCNSPCQVAKYHNTRHCCKCDMTTSCSCENGTPPAGSCCMNADSYGCSPWAPAGAPHPVGSLCDYNGQNGRPAAAWDQAAQVYVDNIAAACPGVYGWQFHDMSSLHTCVDPLAAVDYDVTFQNVTF